jgi:DNA-binding IclR family transcriptional regulator
VAVNTVPILKKAIAVLRAISSQDEETTTKALAQTLALPHSTTYRILQTFMAEDWVRLTPGGRHELSLGLLPMLQPLAKHEGLVETARPILARLAQETKLAAKLSVRQASHAVTLLRAESPLETSVAVRAGASFPIVLGSSGAVLISELSAKERRVLLDQAPKTCWTHQAKSDVESRIAELRKLGTCADFGGFQPSVHALSAAVRDRSGAIAGAFTIVGFVHDFAGKKNKILARELLSAAADCTQRLHGNSVSFAA